MISWRERRPFDYILLASALALTLYGLVLIYSGSSSAATGSVITGQAGRQAAFAIVGVVTCLVVSKLDYRFLAQGYAGMYFGLIGSLLFVLTIGAQVYGSRHWIDVTRTHIKKTEIDKLVIILMLAKYF